MKALLTLLGALVLALASPVARADDRTVEVLYAGSLVNLMEREVGPAFERKTGLRFSGYAAGSTELANQIRGRLRRGDVFVSASPKADALLMDPPRGGPVSWYVSFAASPLTVAYNPQSRFAPEFRTRRWDLVLASPGIRIGRTDPALDPKGALTLDLMNRAAAFYHEPDLARRVLGPPDNPQQVFPEEALVGRIESGQLDAGFFYSTELVTMKLPQVALPPEIAARATYTVTILSSAENPAGGARFVQFLLGAEGRALLRKAGLATQNPTLTGDAGAAPAAIRAMAAAGK